MAKYVQLQIYVVFYHFSAFCPNSQMVQGNSVSVTAALQQMQARTQQTPVCVSVGCSLSAFTSFLPFSVLYILRCSFISKFSSSAGYQKRSQHGKHAEILTCGSFNLWAGRIAVKVWNHKCRLELLRKRNLINI